MYSAQRPNPRRLAGVVLLITVAPLFAADVLLIPDSTSNNRRVMAFDPHDGTLLNPNFITDPGSVNGVQIFNRPLNAIRSPWGTLLVADQLRSLVAEFTFDNQFVGIFSNAGTLDALVLSNIRGIDISPAGDVLVTNSGTGNVLARSKNNVLTFAAQTGAKLDDFAFMRKGGLDGPFDVLVLADEILVANDINNYIARFALDGSFAEVFAFGTNFPQQLNRTATGTILVAVFSGGYIAEYTADGTLLAQYTPPGLSGFRGVIELGNGNILCTSNSGVHEFSRDGTVLSTKFSGSEMRFIERVTLPGDRALADIVDPEAVRAALIDLRPVHPGDPAPGITSADVARERGLDGPLPTADWLALPRAVAEQDLEALALMRGAARPAETSGETGLLTGGRSADHELLILEDSGFFNAAGIVRGRLGSLRADAPATVRLLGIVSADPFNWGGLDYRPGTDHLLGYDNLTNALRTLALVGDETLIESTGYLGNGIAGFTYSVDGQTVFIGGTTSALGRILEADPITGTVLNIHDFLNLPAINGLAVVPAGTDLPFPPGQVWATRILGSFSTELVQFDLATNTILSRKTLTGVSFQTQFEAGLDWAPDGTLYAALQGFRQVGNDFFEVSSHLYTINPVSGAVTALGVLQADETWDVAGLTVVPPLQNLCPGDMNCDTLVNFADIGLFIAAIKTADPADWEYDPDNGVCLYENGDFTGDGLVNFGDISGFIAQIKGSVPPCVTVP
ncbi:MAG: hypothetical protein IPM18_01620 [Phycisphaerales bacterium]|nr:hypothetical protein [Phycisphaerales bacterium]